MKLSISEGLTIAEKQAWAKTGEKHRRWFTWGKRAMPAALVALVLGAIGWALHRVVTWAGDAAGSMDAPAIGVPGAVWFAAALLLVATILGVRAASRAIRFTPAAAIYIGLGMAWCGVIAYGVGIA